jgi:tetratricopeptide (TPR) repeat protein
MLRRTLTFIAFVALVAAVSTLVYLNPDETAFRYPPAETITLPLGVLMLASAIAGMMVMFVLMLWREGRNAVREWRVQRGIRSAERIAAVRAEARSLALAGDTARSRNLFSKAMKAHEPDVSDLLEYADTYIQEGNPGEARRVIENAQKDFGNAPLLLNALARAARMAGDDAGAISALERALAVYPRSLRLLNALRDVLVDTSAWDRAAEIQERIVQLRVDQPVEQQRALGIRYESALRLVGDQRAAALRAITSVDPDFAPAVVERARGALANGDARTGAKILEKAIRSRPRGIYLDELEKLLGGIDPSRVGKIYLRAVEAFPTIDGLRSKAARHLAVHGRHDEAIALLDAAGSSDTRGVLAAARGLLEQARDQLASASDPGRRLATGLLPASSWKCETCKTPSEIWVPRCRTCGSWGTVDDL